MKKTKLFILLLMLMGMLYGCSGHETKGEEKTEPNAAQKAAKQSKQQAEHDPSSKWIKVKGPARIPILMYHSISSGNSLRVPEAEFRGHMKWLKDNGYYTLTPEEAYIVLTQDKMPSEKCVLITFDDGYTDNFTKAFPILKEFGQKATVFMIGKSVGGKNHLTEKQMNEMRRSGISIQSHTIHHVELNGLAPGQQLDEMTRSKALFDRMFSQNTVMLSYPVGRYNEDTLKLAKQAGYQMAVTTEPGAASREQGMHALHRVRISPGMSPAAFGRMVEHNR
ncbi:polysaccharide deacetylase family protein [Bacillus haynesii]|uniref:Polysaccharide deacetylase family protein n=1 Tax=Bacillus haynesii TaxID=1925021 RepID=A0AA90EBX3_9BACI|nr:polysaccharide deacetylase family protein [Bacillus haynesii]MCI4127588.1 polysaccharide deacetylase family protein [Bacillus haynesii]MCY7752155.1 polysaccharide deacetylase family protein [Bacillus haynesii]MCY7769264.1 polysaccharide deacetylase family protein [Bacillus haynesii]MCY7789690.1 polysaccharide deacetylase family protein [Bacillus haynesii]MCY7862206.1 polysaccharide deacetylase family protein [Bacillus haynesii]